MKNRYKVAIGCAGLATMGAALTPQLVYGRALNRPEALQKVVTKRFVDANVNQVLAWLAEQGFNFAALDNQFDDARVTINIENKTVREAADALAAALGGHWSRNGDVFVFHKGEEGEGSRAFAFARPGQPDNVLVIPQHGEDLRVAGPDGQNWEKLGDEMAQRFGPDSEQMKKLQERIKILTDKAGNFQMDPKAMEDIEQRVKVLKDDDGHVRILTPDGDDDKEFRVLRKGDGNFQMDPKQMEELQKHMKVMQEHMKDLQMKPEQMEELQKHMKGMQEHMKDMQEHMKDMKMFQMDPKDMEEMQKNMKVFKMDGQNFQMDPKAREQFEKSMRTFKQNMGQFKMDKDAMKNFNWNGDGDQMSPKKREEFERKMEDWGQKFGDQFGKKFSEQDQKRWEEYGQKMQQWAEKFQKEHPDGKYDRRDFQAMPPMPPLPKMDFMTPGDVPTPPKVEFHVRQRDGVEPHVDVRVRREDHEVGNGRRSNDDVRIHDEEAGPGEGGHGIRPDSMRQRIVDRVIAKENLKKLVNGLSEKQRNLLQDRGYLTPSDLTEEQRGYFNHLPNGGDWTIEFNVDGTDLKLKSH